MQKAIKNCITIVASILISLCLNVWANNSPKGAADENLNLFVVEIKTGANWDNSKAQHEQKLFKEHSMNLRKLRQAGHIVMGARYSDIGLIVFKAKSVKEVIGFMEQDPAIAVGTLKFEAHPLAVFYPGLVSH